MKYLILSLSNLISGVFFLIGSNLCAYMLPLQILSGLGLVCMSLGILFFNLRLFEIFKKDRKAMNIEYIVEQRADPAYEFTSAS